MTLEPVGPECPINADTATALFSCAAMRASLSIKNSIESIKKAASQRFTEGEVLQDIREGAGLLQILATVTGFESPGAAQVVSVEKHSMIFRTSDDRYIVWNTDLQRTPFVGREEFSMYYSYEAANLHTACEELSGLLKPSIHHQTNRSLAWEI